MSTIKLEKSWATLLKEEFKTPYMRNLSEFLGKEQAMGKKIFPPREEVFNAFNLTPFSKVKVVIIGQDPYHGEGQAHGLCFSVRPGVRVPPSLVNIFKELKRDLNVEIPSHGYLLNWAKQGVLLLNSIMTVEKKRPGSHQNKGWERFTDHVVELLNQKLEGVVFVLWGSYAQKKGQNIDSKRHLVLKAAHPSPFSAHRGFMGCAHFSKINAYLEKQGELPIDWNLKRLTSVGLQNP
jgi:uracil-DNA glycosylase